MAVDDREVASVAMNADGDLCRLFLRTGASESQGFRCQLMISRKRAQHGGKTQTQSLSFRVERLDDMIAALSLAKAQAIAGRMLKP